MKKPWSIQDALDLYLINRWGHPYFAINDQGHLEVRPKGTKESALDLKTLVDELCVKDIFPPLLIRFDDILKSRIEALSYFFKGAIDEHEYKGHYFGVMPIKVNQQRHVVECLVQHGQGFGLGLEAGSKPELLVATALLPKNGSLLICNGYKDSEYIEIALDAQLLGIQSILVVDRLPELKRMLEVAKQKNIKPNLGIRAKLSAKGKGKWEDSSGELSKFGLSSREIMEVIHTLKQENMLSCLKLLHFHVGSQITSIRAVRSAVQEAARLYANLRQMQCEELIYLDIGGGLAVDYDGSQTDFHSSCNYSHAEYAKDVVSITQTICDSLNLPHPHLISESGRALLAHHAVLVFNVLGLGKRLSDDLGSSQILKPTHPLLEQLEEVLLGVSKKNLQASYHQAQSAKEECVTLFNLGLMDLNTKALIEDLYWHICVKIHQLMCTENYVPEDLSGLYKKLSCTYYCNFSLFQSLPDSWAVKQLFPIVPLQRLHEEPEVSGVLVDLTCDSDGKIDQFIDLRDVKNTLPLHEVKPGEAYFMGAFLVGAYQEILGDLHNLFGDTHAVHVVGKEGGGYELKHWVKGDSVSQVLSYVEYDHRDLMKEVRLATKTAVEEGRMTKKDAQAFMKRYEQGLLGYTYLEDFG